VEWFSISADAVTEGKDIVARIVAKRLAGNNDGKPTVDISAVKQAGRIIAIAKKPTAKDTLKKA